MTAPATTRSSRLIRLAGPVLLLAASIVVALALGEAALRVLAAAGNPFARRVAAQDPFAAKVEPFGAYGFRPKPGAQLHYFNGTVATANAQRFRGPLVEVPKPAGTWRIILLGESSTHGWGVNDSETIDAYMRAGLRERRPDLHTEVVNLAYDGYDAYQMWQRLLVDGVPLQPDLIIVNAGVNDVRNAIFAHLGDPDPRTLIWEGELQQQRATLARGGPTPWTWAKHFLYVARLRGVIRDIVVGRARARQTAAQAQAYPDAAANFALNIGRIADVADRIGAALVLSTPPSALLLPGAPAATARGYILATREMTQNYRDTLAARLRDIAAAHAGRRPPVLYVSHRLPVNVFLDDVHLTAAGNRAMAGDFVAAIAPLLPPARR